jgi:tRNA dimethylallyltransferase
MKSRKKIIAIVGPTASGKTGVGVKLAKMFSGEIISADSRQVYRGLDIGSGKEGRPEGGNNQVTSNNNQKNSNNQESITKLKKSVRWIDGVPQWVIDITDPGKTITLFDWLDQAKIAIQDILARGKLPIIVGGTGLYVTALVEGYELKYQRSNIKDQNDKVKCKIFSRQELEKLTLKELQKIYSGLGTLDSGLDLNNPRRIIRAIERAQGREEMVKVKPDFETLIIGLDWEREELYRRIDQRADERFKEGMLEETRELLKSQISNLKEKKINQEMAKWLISLGLDYRVMTEYLIKNGTNAPASGKEFEEMVARFKFAEHDYARRQLTWWRNKPITWVKSFEGAEKEIDKFLRS